MLKIFYMDISCGCPDGQSQAFYELLPEERQEQVDRLRKEDMAHRKMLAGVFMQYGLSRVTGIPIEQICYSYGEQGKPELENISREKQVYFNLSHSGKYALLAVSDRLVGADVERLRENRLGVAKRCFHQREYEDIMALQNRESCDRRFLEYWTMKEAYVKRTGGGLRIPMDSFWIRRGEDGVSFVEKADGQRIWIATGYLEETYAFSVCSESRDDIAWLTGKTERQSADGKALEIEEITAAQIYDALKDRRFLNDSTKMQ